MSIQRLAGAIVLALSLSLVIGSPALAKKKGNSWTTYTVPFTCGPNDMGAGSAVAGNYATAVTVTNASLTDVRTRARVQLTDPVRDHSDRISRNLRAGRSFLIDCDTLLDGAFILPVPLDVDSFFQGVLTIDSRMTLNVVVQTSATGLDSGISVENRQVEGFVIRHPRHRGGDDEVEICHIPPGNPSNRHTIEVGASAVGAHMAHGDHEGDCDGG